MFNKKEQKLLQPFFSNIDKPIFILQNMPEVLKGALFSRYSRSSKPLRRLFLDEYLASDELNLDKNSKKIEEVAKIQNILNTEKAKKFYQKWLAMYGDDSIAELGGIHIGIENISMVATKAIEDRRIGVSPLEKSTRYVRYDDKENGKYKYYRDSELLKSALAKIYTETLDFMFDTYSQLMEPMMEYFRKEYPQPEGVANIAYNSSIRAKACDTLRGLLPLGALTNMGIFANGRAIEYLITKLYAEPLPEARQLAKLMHTETKKVIENFVERIESDKGAMYIEYLVKTHKNIEKLAKGFNNTNDQKSRKNETDEKDEIVKPYVKLLDYDKDAEIKTVTSILFPYSTAPHKDLLNQIRKLGKKPLSELLEMYVKERQGRWHKVGKAFEEIYYNFEIVSDIGTYKDLQRHRMASHYRQLFTTKLGFVVPAEVKKAGFEKQYRTAMNKAHKAYLKLAKKYLYQAQYVVGHGHLCRWRIKMNLREAFHLCELRSSPQGHPNYRKVAQEIYNQIKKAHPMLGNTIKFVNMQDPGLERLAAEVRQRQKLDAIGKA